MLTDCLLMVVTLVALYFEKGETREI